MTTSVSTNPTSHEIRARLAMNGKSISPPGFSTAALPPTLVSNRACKSAWRHEQNFITEITDEYRLFFPPVVFCAALLIGIGFLAGLWWEQRQAESATSLLARAQQMQTAWMTGRDRRLSMVKRIGWQLEFKSEDLRVMNERINVLRPEIDRLEARRWQVLEWESRLPAFQSNNGDWFQMRSWPPKIDGSPGWEAVLVSARPRPD